MNVRKICFYLALLVLVAVMLLTACTGCKQKRYRVIVTGGYELGVSADSCDWVRGSDMTVCCKERYGLFDYVESCYFSVVILEGTCIQE